MEDVRPLKIWIASAEEVLLRIEETVFDENDEIFSEQIAEYKNYSFEDIPDSMFNVE